MEWISVKDRLPESGQEVLIFDGGMDIARFKRGISIEEREKMKRGEIPDPVSRCWNFTSGDFDVKRSESFDPADEWGNNLVPYFWKSVRGPMQWFGQNVEYWMPLPEPPGRDTA